jgi:alpha-glucosidase
VESVRLVGEVAFVPSVIATIVLPMTQHSHDRWWETGVVYQIYPRSFQDTNGDGVGDLPGIASRLDYLKSTLGVDAVWISPIFRSPMADFGYDVSDYTDVDPLFGTLADADAVIETAHGLGLKVIIDWVPNHSSDQHPWFLESRLSRDNAKRDWYVWKDPGPDGEPPNNWLSVFGGSAWELDARTGQYYLHSFLVEQPDLNWRNPDVVAAMLDTLRFWLDRGIDGFRVDVAHFMMKDPLFRDNPPASGVKNLLKDQKEYDTQDHLYDKAHPDIFALHRKIRAVVDEYDDRFIIGEIHEADWDTWARYYGEDLTGLHMPFDFSLLWSPWDANEFRSRIQAQEAVIPEGGWGNHVLGNHDEPRFATRFGTDRVRPAAVVLLTLRGTPTMYYGEELGLIDCVVEPGKEQDPWGRTHPDLNRDGCRSPMQWAVGPGMGFTGVDVEPWLPFADPTTSVGTQIDDPSSPLSLYREILALRRSRRELAAGDLAMLDDNSDNVLSFRRSLDGRSTYVAINFTDEEQRYTFPIDVTQLLGTAGPRPGVVRTITLEPNEAVVAG